MSLRPRPTQRPARPRLCTYWLTAPPLLGPWQGPNHLRAKGQVANCDNVSAEYAKAARVDGPPKKSDARWRLFQDFKQCVGRLGVKFVSGVNYSNPPPTISCRHLKKMLKLAHLIHQNIRRKPRLCSIHSSTQQEKSRLRHDRHAVCDGVIQRDMQVFWWSGCEHAAIILWYCQQKPCK